MRTNLWISFDIGIGGDYQGMYRWLASHRAEECGDGLAEIEYEYTHDVLEELRDEIEKNVDLRSADRIYIIVWGNTGIRAGFLIGDGKVAPWSNYIQRSTGGVHPYGKIAG